MTPKFRARKIDEKKWAETRIVNPGVLQQFIAGKWRSDVDGDFERMRDMLISLQCADREGIDGDSYQMVCPLCGMFFDEKDAEEMLLDKVISRHHGNCKLAELLKDGDNDE